MPLNVYAWRAWGPRKMWKQHQITAANHNSIKSLQPIINNVSLFNNENLLRRKTDKTDIFVSVCEVFSFEFIDTRMLFM